VYCEGALCIVLEKGGGGKGWKREMIGKSGERNDEGEEGGRDSIALKILLKALVVYPR